MLVLTGCHKLPDYGPTTNEQQLIVPSHIVGKWKVTGYKLTTIKEGVTVDSIEGRTIYDWDFYTPSTITFLRGLYPGPNSIPEFSSVYYGTYEYSMPDSTAITYPIKYLFPVSANWRMSYYPNEIVIDLFKIKNIPFRIENFYTSSFWLIGRYFDSEDHAYHDLSLCLEK